MGTSIGQGIDYLLATLPPLLLAVDSTSVVVDNFPTVSSQSMVFIGRQGPDDGQAASETRQFLVLGAGRVEEDYLIPCYIEVTRPGPEQKPARDAALALFDAFAHLMVSEAGMTFGGVLQQGRIAQVRSVSLVQTRDGEDAGQSGTLRMAWVTFEIHVLNHYIP